MMESEREKSVPIIKNFQIEGSWAPITPGKASVGGELEAMYEKAYSSRISHQNEEPQTLLSYTITSAQGSSIPSNQLWDESIHGLEQESINLQEYLPHWNSQGRRTKASPILPNPLLPPSTTAALSNTYPCLTSWESSHSHSLPPSFPWENNASLQGSAIHDPLANLTFGQLLALKDSGMSNASLHPNWNPNNYVHESSSIFSNHNNSHQFDQQFTDLFGGQMQNLGGSLHHYQQSVCDADSPLTTKHAYAKNSTFAPATPDLRWRIGNSVASENIPLGTHHRGPNEQNGLESQEQDVAAAMVNLQNVVEEVPFPNTDSSPGKVSTAVENHNPDKGGNQVIDLNKTPQKKTRRRRYQPKVLSEKKPRKTPKPKTPKPTDSKETSRVKRKYVRKNKANTDATPPVEVTDAGEIKPAEADEVGDTETAKDAKSTAKSCRRSLNFDLNGQAAESNFPDVVNGQPNKCQTAAGNQYCNTVHLRQEAELMVEKSRVGFAYDLNRTLNQELENYLSLPTKDYLDNLQPDQNTLSKRKETTPHNLSGNYAEVPSRGDAHPVQSPNSSPCASSNERKQRGSKRGNSCITNVDTGGINAAHCTFWQPNHTIPGNANIGELQKLLHPEIRKKKRTEKVQRLHVPSASNTAAPAVNVNQVAGPQNHLRVDPSASKYYCCDPTPFEVNAVTRDNHAHVLTESVQNRIQLFNTWADLARLKKKRTKGTTRVRNLAQLMGIASVLPAKPGPKGPRKKKIDISENAYTEALPADITAKPKARRSRKQTAENKQRGLVFYDANQPTRKATGSIPAQPWARPSSIEEITEKMVCLDINRKINKTFLQEQNALVPYQTNNQEQNALVVYGRDGTIVPFEGPFEPIRKRRQRAKVDLDDETTKVWKLLLENIDNKGIDGTDEDKTKWWENERSVFRGRVDSFIARMRLVQGDRRFTPWKGSVLDSVIGVFLTQNVSDHLSSSAFMALAAHFPLKSEGSESTLSEESTTALVVEPNICIIEPEESISWNEKTINEQILSRNSRIIHDIDHGDEKEVVNSKDQTARARGSVGPKDCSSESSQKVPNNSIASNANSQTTETETASILGDDRAKDDATSSQHSVISSQNSTYSPNLQTIGMMSNFLESDSRLEPFPTCSQSNYFDSTSFLGLLKMAENPFLHDSYNQNQHDPLECMNHVTKGSLEARGVCSSNYPLNLNFQLSDVKGIEMLEVESKSPDTSRKDENSTPTEQSNLTTESSVQCLAQDRSSDRSSTENMCSCYVLEGEKMIMDLQSEKDASDVVASSANAQKSSASAWKSTNVTSSNSSQVTADVTESTTELKRASYDQKEIKQISVETYASGGITDMTNANASKSKRGNPGKGKTDAFDWDSLRRDAQANGKKREKTPNTRDSLDWEAVRKADVSEIAETIKERGMNNMLAERIKDLLARLVKEHGSINMEWLRDIPPDKAKEYLLSFKGLGLKSVECVRLLTLHHLAFPVDTNVGRIAVRLGWVPLQPLPESLQLHLLELYPVLESIQKYLWPRLCKLDQKTLYELHYHLITFGKVFCTKRQPNCNACPLRGECRHFASAFASARFALPGTEERSIVPSNGGSSAHADPQASINLLPLPPSWTNQHSQSNPTSANGVLTIEAASSSLALPLQHTINHMERQSKITNCEPIVEVPASPEPEPEPEQEQTLCDIEDTLYEDPDEIPTIELNMKQFSQTLQDYMTGKSNALVALTPEAASIPTPKLKNISRLRTEHHVYELPDTHPLLKGLDKREPDDPCSYLLAIWTPGETADSIQPPERRCSSENPSILCNEETCSYCNSLREANSQTVRGTLLIPCRTAMRGSFPLNGTYFQVNEVFADHNSSLNPIAVPRSWLWNLPRRTVYFGTSIPTIFRGLTTEDIQHCFWRGFVCVRGFDQKTRAPRPLMARLHFPASRMPRGAKGRAAYDE